MSTKKCVHSIIDFSKLVGWFQKNPNKYYVFIQIGNFPQVGDIGMKQPSDPHDFP